jgi:peptide/nickel transport system permease protein
MLRKIVGLRSSTLNRFLVRRLLLALGQLLLVSTLVFAMLHLLPGDPVLIILGSERTPDPEAVKAVREKLGLNQSLPAQYANWMTALLRGDFGTSLVDETPVWTALSERLPRTLQLVGVAIILASILGVSLGIMAALNWNTFWDRLLSLVAAVGISAPVYVIAALLVLVFGIRLRVLPISGYTSPMESFEEFLRRLILPAITLACGPMATIMRMTRSTMLEVQGQDYVRTARAKGLNERAVINTHMLRNALIPVITAIGLQMGTLIGGAVLVEYVFNWPGLSTLLVTAIRRRDYSIVQGVVLVSASLFILINLIVDLAYGALDPRIKHS